MSILETNCQPDLLGLDRAELGQLAAEYGEPRFRGDQLFRSIYGRRERDLRRCTDLPLKFRERLGQSGAVIYPEIRGQARSSDGSVRHLLTLQDGETVEAVFMPEETRTTLCISSQAGCAVDCRFCFTALLGLKRNLTAGEIVGQVMAILAAQQVDPAVRLNIVFMGMGEPLLNYAAVMKAIRILAERDGLAISPRRMTLSTAGIIPRISDLANEPVRPKLAISLNASSNEQRSELMPINRKYPLDQLLDACREFPLRPRERMTFEYVLLGGINDSDADARRVGALLKSIRAKVNLIPYNPGSDLPYQSPPLGRVLAFQKILRERDVPAFIRISRGRDVMAACGQLKRSTL